jgi:hypothetical protein
MNLRRLNLRRPSPIQATLALAVLLLTISCTSTAATTPEPAALSATPIFASVGDDDAPGPPAAGLINPDDVDNSNPQAVALATVTTLHRSDTRIDTTPTGAARRATPWMTPELAAGVTTTPASSNSTWLDLETHDGYTDLTAAIADEYGQPPNTDSVAYVQVSYTVTLTGRDGWVSTQPPALDRIQLTKIDIADPWLVSGYLE